MKRTAIVQDQTDSQLALLIRQLTKQVKQLQQKKGRPQEATEKKPLQCWRAENRNTFVMTAPVGSHKTGKKSRAATIVPTTGCTKAPNQSYSSKRHSDPLVGDVLPEGTPAQKRA